jgi:hypothetical protein
MKYASIVASIVQASSNFAVAYLMFAYTDLATIGIYGVMISWFNITQRMIQTQTWMYVTSAYFNSSTDMKIALLASDMRSGMYISVVFTLVYIAILKIYNIDFSFASVILILISSIANFPNSIIGYIRRNGTYKYLMNVYIISGSFFVLVTYFALKMDFGVNALVIIRMFSFLLEGILLILLSVSSMKIFTLANIRASLKSSIYSDVRSSLDFIDKNAIRFPTIEHKFKVLRELDIIMIAFIGSEAMAGVFRIAKTLGQPIFILITPLFFLSYTEVEKNKSMYHLSSKDILISSIAVSLYFITIYYIGSIFNIKMFSYIGYAIPFLISGVIFAWIRKIPAFIFSYHSKFISIPIQAVSSSFYLISISILIYFNLQLHVVWSVLVLHTTWAALYLLLYRKVTNEKKL